MSEAHEPASIHEIALDVKKSTIEEGRSFGMFSEKATLFIVAAIAIFAMSFILMLQMPFFPMGLITLVIGFIALYLGISIAHWVGFKAPNHVDDCLEDLTRCGFGGSRFTLGLYRHPKPDMGKKLTTLLKEAE